MRSICFAILLTLASTCSIAEQNEGVRASYAVEPSAVTLHEPIIVRFEVFNQSKQPITVRMGRDRKDGFSFVVRSPDGSKQMRPELPLREGAFDPGDVSLVHGQRLSQQLLLTEWASFITPGEYELEVRLLTPIEMNSGAKFVAEPYHISFRVLPRDESRLQAACEQLVRKIESTDAVREANAAASALAYVDDPIVVPYLERALRSGRYVEHPVIDGLARIGNEHAVQILTAVVNESPAWPPSVETTAGTRAILAWQALHAIAAATSNERLRLEIQRTIP